MNIEVALEHDFDSFEVLLQTSPKNELNKPRETWGGGNVLHGLFGLTNKNIDSAPSLMECEYEHWLYLIYKAKKCGVDPNHKNCANQTPLEYLKQVNTNMQLNQLVDDIFTHRVNFEYY